MKYTSKYSGNTQNSGKAPQSMCNFFILIKF